MEEQIVKNKKEKTAVDDVMYNPLRKEKVYVRFVPHDNGLPKNHVMSGSKADGASDTFCVPMLSNGNYKNVLTNDEKDFLENILQLDNNALSVYKKENNFWDNFTVKIDNAKEGLYLDLSDPNDYIRYKVLLANTDLIAPSVQERLDRPKKTYMYELVRQVDEHGLEKMKTDATMSSFKEFAKIENDFDTLRVLIEILDGRPYAANTSQEFFRSRAISLIQNDPKGFLSAITDQALHAKVLIRLGTESGVIAKRGDYYFLKADNSPLCESGENPTLSIAARFINMPSHQDVKFLLENDATKKKGKK